MSYRRDLKLLTSRRTKGQPLYNTVNKFEHVELYSEVVQVDLYRDLRRVFGMIIGGSKGVHQGCPSPFLSFSCSFRQNICKIIGFWQLAHSPQENPGSSTDDICRLLQNIHDILKMIYK